MIWENYRMVNCGIGILDWKKELGDVPWKEKPPVTTRSLGIYWSHQFGMFFFHRVFSAGKTLQKPRCNRGVKGKRWLDVTGCLERPTCVFKGSCHVYIALFQRLHHLNFVVVFAQRHTSIRFKGRDFLQSPYIPTSSSGPHHLSVATKMSLPPPPKKKHIPPIFRKIAPIFWVETQLTNSPNWERTSSILAPSGRSTQRRLKALPLHIQMVLLERLANQRLRNARSPEQQEVGYGWMLALVHWVYGFEKGRHPKIAIFLRHFFR